MSGDSFRIIRPEVWAAMGNSNLMNITYITHFMLMLPNCGISHDTVHVHCIMTLFGYNGILLLIHTHNPSSITLSFCVGIIIIYKWQLITSTDGIRMFDDVRMSVYIHLIRGIIFCGYIWYTTANSNPHSIHFVSVYALPMTVSTFIWCVVSFRVSMWYANGCSHLHGIFFVGI